VKIKTNDFDFLKIFKSGLFYFFYEDTPERSVLLKNRKINLRFLQKNGYLYVTPDKKINTYEKKFLIQELSLPFPILKRSSAPLFRRTTPTETTGGR